MVLPQRRYRDAGPQALFLCRRQLHLQLTQLAKPSHLPWTSPATLSRNRRQRVWMLLYPLRRTWTSHLHAELS